MDPNKYDYLEADDNRLPQRYLEAAANAVVNVEHYNARAVASGLRLAGLSISEWIAKLEGRIEELEEENRELAQSVRILSEMRNTQ